MFSEPEIDRMFPLITASPIQPNAEDWEPELEIVDDENENKGRGHGELKYQNIYEDVVHEKHGGSQIV